MGAPVTLFWLLAGHALADYPLQGDFLARFKNRHSADAVALFGARIWPWALGAHALIHGAAVGLITGSAVLGIAETALHAAVDFGKCEGWYGFHADQSIHVGCKLVWTWAAL